MSVNSIVFPAEWHQQHSVQLTWPHVMSDWDYLLDEVEACFVNIANEVAKRQKLIIVCNNKHNIKNQLDSEYLDNVAFFEIESNDTWARDHGGITVFRDSQPVVYDFCFNGWGMKFDANHDNLITQKLFLAGAFPSYEYQNFNSFVLEGGSIESDGVGTVLTTSVCLLSENRNDQLSRQEIEDMLKKQLGANRVLWLESGYLSGDDTDSHIDTLARFCSTDTIAYVQCTDTDDEHYAALKAMEEELKLFKTCNGEPYHLVALPMVTPVFDPDDGHRLPATYANFLIINGAVLFPVYQCYTDEPAIEAINTAFPEHKIVPIDCSVLIRQHGSLHCVTMQYPEGKSIVNKSIVK